MSAFRRRCEVESRAHCHQVGERVASFRAMATMARLPPRRYSLPGSLPQGELTGTNVGMQTVSTGPFPPERAKQTAVRLAESEGIHFAGDNRGIDMRVSRRVTHGDRQVASVKLDVLVARDVLEMNFTEGDASVEIGVRWDADRNGEVISRAAGDAHIGSAVLALETDLQLLGVVGLLARELDGDLVLGRADHMNLPGADAQPQFAAGGEIFGKGMVG